MGNDHSEGPAGEQETANQVPQLQPIRHPLGVSAVALTALVALALFYTLYFGRDFFLPIAIASTLALLFSPAIAGLSKAHIPQPVGAAIILILLVGAVVTTVLLLSAPANHWLKSAPENLQRVEENTASTLDALPATDRGADICALDDALDALAKREPRRVKVIELRYFGGLSVEETAEALGVSPQTVLRDWRLARAWLAVELRKSGRS